LKFVFQIVLIEVNDLAGSAVVEGAKLQKAFMASQPNYLGLGCNGQHHSRFTVGSGVGEQADLSPILVGSRKMRQ
jgi:hypothetical protein